MTMTRTSLAVAAIVVAFAASAWGRDNKEDMKMLEGTWLPVSGENAGEKFPEEVMKTITLVIKDGKYSVTVGKQPDKGTVSIDATKKPKEMDLVGTEGPNKDKKILAIYEVTDDTLKVCYNLDGKERPKEFKTKEGTKELLFTYKRQKP
jgi:uncharacterized protein (TIGR03067 family)